jgi:endogenous inhibitor of DNA gyrase (YacG/DUF329 family)
VESRAPARPAVARCPRCGAATAWRGNPQRPFCSLACRLLDLGAWLDERYRVAGPEIAVEGSPDADDPRAG